MVLAASDLPLLATHLKKMRDTKGQNSLSKRILNAQVRPKPAMAKADLASTWTAVDLRYSIA